MEKRNFQLQVYDGDGRLIDPTRKELEFISRQIGNGEVMKSYRITQEVNDPRSVLLAIKQKLEQAQAMHNHSSYSEGLREARTIISQIVKENSLIQIRLAPLKKE